jgi:hypothetical protein
MENCMQPAEEAATSEQATAEQVIKYLYDVLDGNTGATPTERVEAGRALIVSEMKFRVAGTDPAERILSTRRDAVIKAKLRKIALDTTLTHEVRLLAAQVSL